jgi:two-component system, OmpR family, response regulator
VDFKFSPVILIVEDEWLVREDVASEFRRLGCTVLETSTGEGAMGLIESGEQIDALITDIQLAGKASGWDVAEVFHAHHPDLPVVYTSGNAAAQERFVPGSIFVPKPCSPAALVEACSGPEPRRRTASMSRN